MLRASESRARAMVSPLHNLWPVLGHDSQLNQWSTLRGVLSREACQPMIAWKERNYGPSCELRPVPIAENGPFSHHSLSTPLLRIV